MLKYNNKLLQSRKAALSGTALKSHSECTLHTFIAVSVVLGMLYGRLACDTSDAYLMCEIFDHSLMCVGIFLTLKHYSCAYLALWELFERGRVCVCA